MMRIEALGSHTHKFGRGWSHYDKWHKWRENQADRLHAARKIPSKQGRRESLRWRLENKSMRPALRSVLCAMLRQHPDDPAYDIVDAFLDILTALKPDCDAGREVRWVGSKFGVPVERNREEILAWLQETPGDPSRHPQEALAGVKGPITAPMDSIPGGSSHSARGEESR